MPTTFSAALLAALLAASAAPAGYHVIKSLPLGGDGGWDYLTVDPGARRLYVSRGDHVVVVDLDSEKVVGEIKNTPGVHGVAVAPDLKRGFVSSGRANSVTVFDLGSLATLAEVAVGQNPDSILYHPQTRRVFTFNGRSADATAIDASTGKVIGTIPLGGKPEAAVAVGQDSIYVNIEDKSELVAFGARDLKVASRWSLAPCEEPTGLALDAKEGRLFAGCGNQLMAVIDAARGKVLATLPIGRGVDGTAFDAERQLAFSSNGEGTLTVVREDSPGHFAVAESVPTQTGARTLALDPQTHRLYLSTAQFGPAPSPTPERPRPRGAVIPGSFVVLVVGQ